MAIVEYGFGRTISAFINKFYSFEAIITTYILYWLVLIGNTYDFLLWLIANVHEKSKANSIFISLVKKTLKTVNQSKKSIIDTDLLGTGFLTEWKKKYGTNMKRQVISDLHACLNFSHVCYKSGCIRFECIEPKDGSKHWAWTNATATVTR